MNLQMLIKDRVQLIMKMHNMTPSMFADKIEVQRSNISHVLSGRSKPGLDLLEKIVRKFPRVDAHWLITGEESDVKSDQQLKIQLEEKVDLVPLTKKEVKTVVFYDDATYDVFLPNER